MRVKTGIRGIVSLLEEMGFVNCIDVFVFVKCDLILGLHVDDAIVWERGRLSPSSRESLQEGCK